MLIKFVILSVTMCCSLLTVILLTVITIIYFAFLFFAFLRNVLLKSPFILILFYSETCIRRTPSGNAVVSA